MIVLDLGCYHHPDHEGTSQDSIRRLTERFHPDELWGFDPHPAMPNWEEERNRDGTLVVLARLAAWTHEGAVPYDPRPDAPLSASVGSGPQGVPCFDIADGIDVFAKSTLERIVVKMDVEGAEFPLLNHLIATGAIRHVSLLLVEWHLREPGDKERRDAILARLPCPVEDW